MRYVGAAYRAHDPRWAFSPLSGEGARLYGGRFNPKGMAALYLSMSIETALSEANRGFSSKLEPTTLVEYSVDCEDIVDLTAYAECIKHDVTDTVLACAWLALQEKKMPVPSQELALRLRSAGAAGILVPSFANAASSKGVNLVLWQWDGPPYSVVVHDPQGRLEKYPRL